MQQPYKGGYCTGYAAFSQAAILDEPTGGLIYMQAARAYPQGREGVTVLFSSHIHSGCKTCATAWQSYVTGSLFRLTASALREHL